MATDADLIPAAPGRAQPSPAEIAAALSRAGLADVSHSTLRRALYSSDASLYRVVPAVVACPRDAGEVAAALAACASLGVPVTSRGAGTSIAGNAIGAGVILDFRQHMNQIVSLDPGAGTATVQPGVVQAALQRAAAPHGLRFGPDPSTHDRATLGGMIGNNSCGSRSLQYGRTAENVLALEVLTGTGTSLQLAGPPGGGPAGAGRAGPGPAGAGGPDGAGDPQLAALREIVAGGLGTIRTELGRFGRQVSGYALEHLLPERGFDVRRALVGSEGTLGIVTGATVRLVRDPPHRILAVLGYPDMASAADAVPAILPLRPATCEGMDSRLVDVVRRRRGDSRVPALPAGSGWLLVEVTGESRDEALSEARRVLRTAGAISGLMVTDPGHAAALWQIREQGAGLASRTAAGAPAYPGWEDSAVPPGSLGAYLRELEELLAGFRLDGVPYGHFGDGCLHLRLDFPLDQPGGRTVLRDFLREAAVLVTRYGGSLSGEHGDGRARSELLPVMYSPAAIRLFGQVKHVFDPAGLLNPGVLVQPRPVDADVRAAALAGAASTGGRGTDRRSAGGQGTGRRGTSRWSSGRGRRALPLPHDNGDFAAAVHRCSGVGKCVASTAGTTRVMCPSYQATGDERDSTRGRARVLQEMVNGTVVTGGWRAPEVRQALDLCLSCKACSAECPVGVDMAAYKSETLHQAYRWRPRPRSHYALGQLPRWAALAALAPGAANALLARPVLGRAARLAAGIDQRRSLPPFAAQTFRAWFRQQGQDPGQPAGGASPGRPAVLLLVDTFTDYFAPQIGRAAVRVLAAAGYQVTISPRPTCCAITWISTGQLGAARRILGRTVAELGRTPDLPVVGLEPSCTATLRSDAPDLLGTAAAASLASRVRTLSELLAGTPGWTAPRLDGTAIVAQPHCHHAAVLGWDTDAALLRGAGAEVTRLGGCCGLAGNFGMERGHYEVSAAVARTALLPAVRAAGPGTAVLADGFSCRTQLADLAGQPGQHLAELLASRLPGDSPQPGASPERGTPAH
ncbi:MAG TPA: FAD-binding and (Fe-S)-binding domain-containing protein [Streptosporangiaceae bacterium]|nr:FAD-binding and (Fe-S)-binding domain-containing protein [Streptosporangiaceae bacterium]